jgi:hypothetical protein
MLEPVLGAALATNTAYLSFARFRYRIKIRDHARKELNGLEGNGTISAETKATELYQRIDRLARLEDNDEDIPSSPTKAKMPPGWAWFYTHLFETHLDRTIAAGLIGLSAVLLILGVAHQIELLSWTAIPFTKDYIWISYWVALAAISAPLGFIALGKRVVHRVTHYCRDEANNLLEFMKAQIPKEEVPLGQRIEEYRRSRQQVVVRTPQPPKVPE